MRVPISSISTKARAIPELRFEDQQMTSYGGLVVFQQLFARLGLASRLEKACRHIRVEATSKGKRFYRHSKVLQCLIIHLIIGCRQLREIDYWREDPLAKYVLGLSRLPSVPTLSRMLTDFDHESIAEQQALNRDLVLERLHNEGLTRVTLDFDGSVQSTSRHAEGTAVGFNKKKKGARSYYPLFCTIAQTGQVFDHLHRSGNVHDSNGSIEFVRHCVDRVRDVMPRCTLEVRMDSAFFSDELISALEELGVEYTVSVPFERFTELKQKIQKRSFWWRTPGGEGRLHHFEGSWKPKKWGRWRRFVYIRSLKKAQNKAPLQLDLFEPVEVKHEYKVIVTNKKSSPGRVVRYHEGRGYQERILGELKSQVNMSYVPARRRVSNQVYLNCVILAHTLAREVQMQVQSPQRGTTAKRTVKWVFNELATMRRTFIQQAARLTRPQGKLTLTFAKNPALKETILQFLPARAA